VDSTVTLFGTVTPCHATPRHASNNQVSFQGGVAVAGLPVHGLHGLRVEESCMAAWHADRGRRWPGLTDNWQMRECLRTCEKQIWGKVCYSGYFHR